MTFNFNEGSCNYLIIFKLFENKNVVEVQKHIRYNGQGYSAWMHLIKSNKIIWRYDDFVSDKAKKYIYECYRVFKLKAFL